MVQSDGDIILLQSLDYETQQQYQIIVMAMVCYNMYIILIIRCIINGSVKCGVPSATVVCSSRN